MRFADSGETLEIAGARWNERDFDQLGWHDCRVHAIAFSSSETDDPFDAALSLDLDYILRWVPPSKPGGHYRFWIAPTTLVFRGAFNLRGTLSADLDPFELDEISRETTRDDDGNAITGSWEWTVAGHDFSFSFVAAGFDQYARAMPVLSSRQHLLVSERGGLCFARQPAW